MGQCIYVTEEPLSSRRRPGPKGPQTREMRSEEWMNPAEAGRILAEGHFLNTTVGVWLYELDVHDKKALRKKLEALVDYVCSPDFLPEYETFGRALHSPEYKARQQARLDAWKARKPILLPAPFGLRKDGSPRVSPRPTRKATAAELAKDAKEYEELCGPMCLGYPTNPKPARKRAKSAGKKRK